MKILEWKLHKCRRVFHPKSIILISASESSKCANNFVLAWFSNPFYSNYRLDSLNGDPNRRFATCVKSRGWKCMDFVLWIKCWLSEYPKKYFQFYSISIFELIFLRNYCFHLSNRYPNQLVPGYWIVLDQWIMFKKSFYQNPDGPKLPKFANNFESSQLSYSCFCVSMSLIFLIDQGANQKNYT